MSLAKHSVSAGKPEFSTESVAELAEVQPPGTWTWSSDPEHESSSSSHQENTRTMVGGLNNQALSMSQPDRRSFDYIPLPLGKIGSFDPLDALPPVKTWATDQQRRLITYFVERLAPWLSQYEDGLTPTSPRLSWLPESIDHPPLFHASPLCASVHIDRFAPWANPQLAVWLKAETLRLLNQSLSNVSEGASDRNIIVALVLLYFNVGGGNPTEYETHLRGINQIVKLKGGIATLGLRGIVKNWLAICHGPWSEGWESGHFFNE